MSLHPAKEAPDPPLLEHQWRALRRLAVLRWSGIWVHFVNKRSLHKVCTGLSSPKQDSTNGGWKDLHSDFTPRFGFPAGIWSRARIWVQSLPSPAKTVGRFQVMHQPLPHSREWTNWEDEPSMLRTLPDLKKRKWDESLPGEPSARKEYFFQASGIQKGRDFTS